VRSSKRRLNGGAKKIYATGRDVSQLEGLIAKFQGKVVAVELDVTNPEQIKDSHAGMKLYLVT